MNGPELSVVPDPEREGTVSILHRGHGRDGCHAVLDALDEDARAWVQFQLDLGPPSSEAPPPPAPAPRPSGRGLPPLADEDGGPPSTDASPESLVRRADDAVVSYDFERARALLERGVAAWDRSRLDDVVKRAAAWLEAQGREGGTAPEPDHDGARRARRGG